MKLNKNNISAKDGSGDVVLRPEDPEDMWHVYNLIAKNDEVKADTYRKVVSTSSTGSTRSEKRKITLTLRVQETDFDPQESTLRVKGVNVVENKFVKIGASHTIELEPNRNFTLCKPCWDTIFMERIKLSIDVSKKADLAAIVMQPGLAHLCLITSHMTVVRAKIEKSIPKKRSGRSGHDKALLQFYKACMQAIDLHIDFNIVKCVLIGSPGFFKDDFVKYMQQNAIKNNMKDIHTNMSKFVTCHSPSGHKHDLKNVLEDEDVQKLVQDTQASDEIKVLGDFFKLLNDNPDQAYYGYNHCVRANESNAIASLLVTDELFRSCDLKKRVQYVKLVESVRDNGGEVHVFSALHVSGEQLSLVSGVAAILKFPMPEIEEYAIGGDESSEEDDDEEETKDDQTKREMEDAEDALSDLF